MDDFKKYIGKKVTVTVDRKMGSKHPKWGYIYPNNYGYIPNTVSGDGEELDAYILGVFEPVESFEGVCIAVLHRLTDDDDKLIVVPENVDYTDEQINALTEYQERFFMILSNFNLIFLKSFFMGKNPMATFQMISI